LPDEVGPNSATSKRDEEPAAVFTRDRKPHRLRRKRTSAWRASLPSVGQLVHTRGAVQRASAQPLVAHRIVRQLPRFPFEQDTTLAGFLP
jgi:hypothetical protein